MENIEKIEILGNTFYVVKNDDIMIISKTKEKLENNSVKIYNLLYPDEYQPQLLNTERKIKFIDYFDIDEYMRYQELKADNYFTLLKLSIYKNFKIRPIFYNSNPDSIPKITALLFFKTDDLHENMYSTENLIDKNDIINNKDIIDDIGNFIGEDYQTWISIMHNKSDFNDFNNEPILRLDKRFYFTNNYLNRFIVRTADLKCNF